MADIVASTLAKLKNHARSKGIQFQQVLNLFCQEEFLRRISKSVYHEKLILKGGFLLYSVSGFATRPTKDTDYLLCNHSNDIAEVERMVNDIIHTTTAYEFIVLRIRNLEVISELKEYSGIRINLIGAIGSTETPFSIDLGFGDVIVPNAIEREIHVILDDFERPVVKTYTLESSISEKLDAIISLMEVTGRMKDFYDIYYLATNFEFDGNTLQRAIHETLINRNREIRTDSVREINRLTKNSDIHLRWNNFCKKILKHDLDFELVIQVILKLVEPPYHAIMSNETFNGVWDCEKWTY